MKCHVHHLVWVAVWVDKQCFMLRRCTGCRRFAVGFVFTKDEPFRNSGNIDVDQIPKDKLQELMTFVSRIPEEKSKPGFVRTLSFAAD